AGCAAPNPAPADATAPTEEKGSPHRGALPMLRIGNGSGSLRSPPGSRCAARSGSSQAAVDRLASLL
ncbi:hypothetical protein ABWK48_33230, partial [Rhodococcus baikonurensis]|uniref:hypothetical protein n=1 Tax=Rhodococcus baikonurensis TaxID=172041 RepID=UPI00339A96B8